MSAHTEIINNEHFEKQYVFHPADTMLKDLVEYYWQLDLRGNILSGNDFEEKIFTNLHTSVVFNMGSAFDVTDTSTKNENKLSGSVVIGHHTHTLQYHHYAGNFLFGIKFRPAGLNKLFGIPLAGLNNGYAEAELFFRDRFIEERLFELANMHPRAVLMDSILLEQLRFTGSHYRINPVHRALVELAMQKQVYNVSQLAGSLHVTKRTLERYFRDEIGLGPKTCVSIIRFREALKKYGQGNINGDFESLGYVDRSHFLKDYRRFVAP